jgi:hypothetical protein
VAAKWIAIAWPDRRANTALIGTALPVRPSVVTSMAQGLLVRHVHRSIRV